MAVIIVTSAAGAVHKLRSAFDLFHFKVSHSTMGLNVFAELSKVPTSTIYYIVLWFFCIIYLESIGTICLFQAWGSARRMSWLRWRLSSSWRISSRLSHSGLHQGTMAKSGLTTRLAPVYCATLNPSTSYCKTGSRQGWWHFSTFN